MKRLEEKVRDIVDVRSSAILNDFLADPTETLGGYHFTDITADLMAKWIDGVADVKTGQGAGWALAGFRGVGKSHFLAALGAIISKPELRAGITDSHVMAKAQRLSRRHGVVAYVRRGSSDSLLAELKNAIADTIGVRSGELSDSLNELLSIASDKSGEMPFVLLIDTASGRQTRVARDDGALLSEIADAASRHGVFVGLALDDDIAGADGMNSSIASSFAIDYLDQEHLYKIVNAYVFAKQDQMRPVLHEIYDSYRAALPGFRWSEHRFSSLYPLHPAILEIAPFVRLYLHDFALLGFAAEAGVKILGRPANSLIGLDEVFDSVETRLRGVEDLKEAFAAYDALGTNVIAKAPVMKRHEAKLILKGLLLLSFNGEGVTANELSASMLILDEADPAAGEANVKAMLDAFASELPDAIRKSESPDRDVRYSFKLASEDNLSQALEEAIEHVSTDVVETVLKRQTAEKFSDFVISDEGLVAPMKFQAIWCGGIRRGEVVWLKGDDPLPEPRGKAGDWRIFIRPASAGETTAKSHQTSDSEWKLAEPTTEDTDTIRRFYALQNDTGLREKYRESIPTVLHVHSIAVEKIWQRIFLDESRLIHGESELSFTQAANSSHSLAQLIGIMLEDHFERQFPSHPDFRQILGAKEVSLLTEHLFNGAGTSDSEIQKLAVDLALPLGLVKEHDGTYIPLSAGDLAELDIVKEALDGTNLEKTDVIPINEMAMRLGRPPYGLTEEAQHLVLTALVAQRQFEFVTSSGNRISSRSLDLQIIWDDIIGLARPSAELYSGERLLSWAIRLTGNASLKEPKTSEARLNMIDALSEWLSDWQGTRLVESFDRLPDESLNSRLWRIATNVKKNFTVVAEAIDGMLQDAITLDQCLQNIADVFSDSEDEFESKQNDLLILRQFLTSSAEGEAINSYLALCEPTGDAETENLRQSLLESLVTSYSDHKEAADTEFRERWHTFRARYADLYVERHDVVMAPGKSRAQLDEFLATDLWSTFTDLSAIPWFGRQDLERAMATVREFRHSECVLNVRELLDKQPFCACSFSLANGKEFDVLTSDLRSTVTNGLELFCKRLLAQKKAFSTALNESKEFNGEALARLKGLPSFLEENNNFPTLTAQEMQVLRSVTQKLPGSRQMSTDRRRPAGESFRADETHEVEAEPDRLQDISQLNA